MRRAVAAVATIRRWPAAAIGRPIAAIGRRAVARAGAGAALKAIALVPPPLPAAVKAAVPAAGVAVTPRALAPAARPRAALPLPLARGRGLSPGLRLDASAGAARRCHARPHACSHHACAREPAGREQHHTSGVRLAAALHQRWVLGARRGGRLGQQAVRRRMHLPGRPPIIIAAAIGFIMPAGKGSGRGSGCEAMVQRGAGGGAEEDETPQTAHSTTKRASRGPPSGRAAMYVPPFGCHGSPAAAAAIIGFMAAIASMGFMAAAPCMPCTRRRRRRQGGRVWAKACSERGSTAEQDKSSQQAAAPASPPSI